MRSLYFRIFFSYWAVMALIVAGAIGMTWLVLQERAEDLPRMQAERVAAAAQALERGGEPALVDWLRGPQPGDVRVFVVDESGRELLDRALPPFFGRHHMLRPHGPPEDLPEDRPERGPPPFGAGIHVEPSRPLPTLVTEGGRRYGVLVLPLRRPYGPFGVPETRWGILFLALAATGIASWLLARSVTRPVNRLSAATRALADGDLDARVEGYVSARRDEIGVLARDFDTMAARLRELLRAKERLLRDVSHELRSPLARMRVALGLARQSGGDVERQLARLEAETERLDRLIGQVLQLSRLDARASTLTRESVDLVELVDGIARDASFEAQSRGVTVATTPPVAPLHVRGDAPLLASAIENVVRNAVRYTAPGSEVRIELVAAPGAAEVRVRDRGPGVPEAELERIFEPFHRVAESRERESGGDGIGLAITARVLAAHGGSARAVNAAGGGLEVVISVPAA